MKHFFQEYAVLLILKKSRHRHVVTWGSAVFWPAEGRWFSFEGFAYPNESKHKFIGFIYIFYTLFVYTTLRVCILTSRSLACFPQCVFVITTGASIFVAGPQHQQSSLSWSSTSNSSGCVNMGPLVAFAFSSASAPQRGTSPFTWLQMSGFFVSRLHHEGSPPWPGRWAPGTAA